MRTNSRPVARAIDSPIEVLPVPGGPIRVRIAPAPLPSSAIPRSRRSRRTAMYSVIRSLTSSSPAWSASSTSRACTGIELLVRALAPRNAEQPVEVGADHRRLATRLAHALEPAELTLGLLANGVGHRRVGDLSLVLLCDRGVVLVELLSDRLHLLSQEVLALLLLRAGIDVVANAAAYLELGQALALKLERKREALVHVDRLQQALLVVE